MSSDSSVTVSTESRVRQFGLYRTIDARTEEFLRLSKKRQIKQGCACAAVSTAITITIVVSILLVYEYSMNSDFHTNKKYATKPKWHGWINDSADVTPFEQKYLKNKLNLDKTTLKLLPMLLNALKRNIYLDSIIDETSSSTPTYDEKDTTEFTYKKDVFNDIRNWYKMPTSRLYAIEYKTSPVVYYRSPIQNIEYFTKIRKIRDSQRILNYFDKMIGDKVGYNSAISTITEETYKTEKPQRKLSTIPMKNYNTAKSVQRSVVSSKSVKNIGKLEVGCKCPKKLGELLTKLISSISHLIPYAKLPITLCKEKPLKQKSKPLSKYVAVIKKTTTTSVPPEEIVTSSSTTVRNIKTSTAINEQNKILESKIFHFPLFMNILKPINEKLNSGSNTLVFHDKPTTGKNYIDATETNNKLPTTTKPLKVIWKNEHDYQSLFKSITRKDYLVKHSTIKPSKKFQSNLSAFDEDEYEDYFATTPNVINDFDTLDTKSLALVKTKMISPINEVENVKIKLKESPKSKNVIQKQNIKYNTEDLKFTVIKNYQNDNDSNETNQNDNESNETINHRSKLFSELKLTNSFTFKPQVQSKNLTTPDPPKNNKLDTITSVPSNVSNEIYTLDQLLNNENIILDDDKNLQEEELLEIDNTNQTINSVKFANKTDTKFHQMPANNNKITDDKLEAERFEEIVITRNYSSMLPEDRPVYLEIQRNEWRQDDHQDFDMNFNNNLFDLTNI